MNIASSIVLFIILCGQSGLALRCWTCENAANNDECLRRGRASYCFGFDQVCEDEVRLIEGYAIIGKRCKQRRACQSNVNQNFQQFSPAQCSGHFSSSTCRCCCQEDMCNRDLLACWRKAPQYRRLSAAAPSSRARDTCVQVVGDRPHAEKHCYGNEKPGAYCDFLCHKDYKMVGSQRITCQNDLTWDNPLPRCRTIVCPAPPRAPKNGYVTCSDGRSLHSHCRFSCPSDHKLSGSYESTCVDGRNQYGTGIWTSPRPFCKPLYCSGPPKLSHGKVTCSRGKKAHSVCRFKCDKDYELFPRSLDQVRCLRTEEWSPPKMPCCTLPCPPNLVVDFVVVMDSSSSVGAENWIKMKRFVRSFLDDFTVRDNSAHYSIIRYNDHVDTETQILFDDFPNDKEALLNAFDLISYNGSGTNTGMALNYVTRTLLKRGNRRQAKDVVLLITDGESNDRVAIPAIQLRRTGAIVYVLPVKPPHGQLNMRQIETIAGRQNRHNILRNALVSGFEALNEEFAQEMSERLCSDPCFDPFA